MFHGEGPDDGRSPVVSDDRGGTKAESGNESFDVGHHLANVIGRNARGFVGILFRGGEMEEGGRGMEEGGGGMEEEGWRKKEG